jgi:hypothetical protein
MADSNRRWPEREVVATLEKSRAFERGRKTSAWR